MRAEADMQYDRVGSEFLVNTGSQNRSSGQLMTNLSDGRYVVTWESWSPAGGNSRAVVGQIFNFDGSKWGGEFTVQAMEVGFATTRSVTALASGGFAIAWEDWAPSRGDELRARVYGADGLPQGPSFSIHGDFRDVSLAGLADGGFVAALSNGPYYGGVQGLRFDAQGTRIGSQFEIGKGAYWSSVDAEVKAMPAGGFAVVWAESGQGYGVMGPKLRLYDANFAPLSAQPIDVDQSPSAWMNSSPDLDVLASGDLVVVWRDSSDPNSGDVKGRLYSSWGAPLGAEFLLSAGTIGYQADANVAAAPGGGFLVTWTHENADYETNQEVRAQAFDGVGQKVGEEFTVNRQNYNGQFGATPLFLSDGTLLVAWTDRNGADHDSHIGVKAQMFGAAVARMYDTEGDDLLAGGSGAQIFVVVRGGNDHVDGGSGADRLEIDASLFGGGVQLRAESRDGGHSGTASWNGAHVTFNNIEQFTVIGSADGADRVTTGAGDDRLELGGGDDVADTGAGIDVADGGAGSDGISADLSAGAVPIVWDLPANLYKGSGGSFTNFEYFGILTTGAGNDRIVSGRGLHDESLHLGSGNDQVTVFGGRDRVEGGAGSDTLIVDYRGAVTPVAIGTLTANATGGRDGTIGDGGANQVTFTSIETIRLHTGSAADRLVSNGVAYEFDLGAGDDIFEGNQLSSGHGGEGNDGLVFTYTGRHDLIWGLGGSGSYYEKAWPEYNSVDGRIYGFEYFKLLITGSGSDSIGTSGLPLADEVRLGSGYDRFTTRNGHDIADGGPDNDWIEIAWGDSTRDIAGTTNAMAAGHSGSFGDGADRKVDFTAFEAIRLRTGSGNDVVDIGGLGGDVETGGGNDIVRSGSGTATIRTGAGDDRIFVGTGRSPVDGGEGMDGLAVDYSAETVGRNWQFSTRAMADAGYIYPDTYFRLEYFIEAKFGSGNDHVVTRDLALPDRVEFGAGDDYGQFFDGHDWVAGGIGRDFAVVRWSNFADPVTLTVSASSADGHSGFADGGASRSFTFSGLELLDLYTGAGADVIRTGGLSALVSSGAGDDVVETGDDHDYINGGLGADRMIGHGGNDIYIVDNVGDVVEEQAGEGTDEVRTALGSRTVPAEMYALPANVENLRGTSALAQGVYGNALDNVIKMGAGGDLVVLDGGGDDRVDGGGGNDFVYFGGAFTAADGVVGGAGTDTVALLGSYSLTLGELSLVGVETLALYSSGNAVAPNGYALTMHDGNVAAGQKLLVNAQSLLAGETLVFDGGAERDGSFDIRGGRGSDTITGGVGADRIAGNLGADTLRGGAGADIFVYRSAADSTASSRDTILGLRPWRQDQPRRHRRRRRCFERRFQVRLHRRRGVHRHGRRAAGV
jgi:Ca2+-binding RTX toxin-like protein